LSARAGTAAFDVSAARSSLHALGDSALLLRWHGDDLAACNAQVHRTRALIEHRWPPWLQDLVPSFTSLALRLDIEAEPAAISMAEQWLAHHANLLDGPDEQVDTQPRLVQIPVCYDAVFGLDLLAMADATGLSVAEIINRHTAPTYRVAMLGFAPGFPYLLGLDPTLATPRLATPRPLLAAGSVGIGGAQTGVYPQAGPGGWRILGRTPLRMFDATRTPPCLAEPGDALRFVAIDHGEFERLAKA